LPAFAVNSPKLVVGQGLLKIKPICLFDRKYRLKNRQVEVIRRTFARHPEYSVEFADEHTCRRTG